MRRQRVMGPCPCRGCGARVTLWRSRWGVYTWRLGKRLHLCGTAA